MEALAILVPVLNRPQNVKPLVESIERSIGTHTRVLFMPEPGVGPEQAAIEWVAERYAGHPSMGIEVYPERGGWAHKINVGIRVTHEPLLFTGADDLVFHPGWFEAAKRRLTEGIGVVGTNDLCNPKVMRGDHATHFLFTREYVEAWGTIDEPGKLLHEGYEHEWVDNELVETACFRGAYAFAPDAKVEHRHPLFKQDVEDDGTYGIGSLSRRRMYEGHKLFLQRRHLWQN